MPLGQWQPEKFSQINMHWSFSLRDGSPACIFERPPQGASGTCLRKRRVRIIYTDYVLEAPLMGSTFYPT